MMNGDDVVVLERFSFMSVPADEAERVVTSLEGMAVRGHALELAAIPA